VCGQRLHASYSSCSTAAAAVAEVQSLPACSCITTTSLSRSMFGEQFRGGTGGIATKQQFLVQFMTGAFAQFPCGMLLHCSSTVLQQLA
jgi:hypothetical protein